MQYDLRFCGLCIDSVYRNVKLPAIFLTKLNKFYEKWQTKQTNSHMENDDGFVFRMRGVERLIKHIFFPLDLGFDLGNSNK